MTFLNIIGRKQRCSCFPTDKFEALYRLAGTIFGKETDGFIKYFQGKLDYVREHLAGVQRKTVYYEYKKPGWTTVDLTPQKQT